MGQIESRETMFLDKIQELLTVFDEADRINREIEEMINNQPLNQSQVDQLLSDYYHLIENNDLNDNQFVLVGKEIKKAREKRRDESSTAQLIKCYQDNKKKLSYMPKETRVMFENAIKSTCNSLHEKYKYRILNENDLQKLKDTTEITKKENKIDKAKEMFKHHMKNKDIAKELKVTPSYVSLLRKKMGYSKVK